jgi:hypothetical protein
MNSALNVAKHSRFIVSLPQKRVQRHQAPHITRRGATATRSLMLISTAILAILGLAIGYAHIFAILLDQVEGIEDRAIDGQRVVAFMEY